MLPDSIARGQSLTVNITLEPGFKSFEPSVITIPGEEVNKDVVIQVSTHTENVLSGISYSMSTTQVNAFLSWLPRYSPERSDHTGSGDCRL